MFAAMLVIATPTYAKAVKVVEPLAKDVIGSAHVVSTDIVIGETARPIVDQLEQYAVAKRTEARLPPLDAAAGRPAPDSYATLPVATMIPLVVDDVTRDWGLTGGRAVKLTIMIDMLRTADAGAAILIGSADELAGDVIVSDAESGVKLGEFYVDVLNVRAGLLGLAMRGSGVREKLTAEFAQHISKQLTGKSDKPGKKA